MCYAKTGRPRFISHLDFVRLFERAARRAGLPLAFSEGFSPAPRIAYGWPLPVGMPGLGEYVDVELRERAAPERVVDDLNRVLPQGLAIREARYLSPHGPSLMAEFDTGSYMVHLPGRGRSLAEWREAAAALLARSSLEVIREKGAASGQAGVPGQTRARGQAGTPEQARGPGQAGVLERTGDPGQGRTQGPTQDPGQGWAQGPTQEPGQGWAQGPTQEPGQGRAPGQMGASAGRKIIDVRPLIRRLEVREFTADGRVAVFMELALGDRGAGRPDEVAGLLVAELAAPAVPTGPLRRPEGMTAVRLGFRRESSR